MAWSLRRSLEGREPAEGLAQVEVLPAGSREHPAQLGEDQAAHEADEPGHQPGAERQKLGGHHPADVRRHQEHARADARARHYREGREKSKAPGPCPSDVRGRRPDALGPKPSPQSNCDVNAVAPVAGGAAISVGNSFTSACALVTMSRAPDTQGSRFDTFAVTGVEEETRARSGRAASTVVRSGVPVASGIS